LARRQPELPAALDLVPQKRESLMLYEIYTQQGLSINAIAWSLNEREIPTRTGKSRWERSSGKYIHSTGEGEIHLREAPEPVPLRSQFDEQAG
jgi:hypothetical protein